MSGLEYYCAPVSGLKRLATMPEHEWETLTMPPKSAEMKLAENKIECECLSRDLSARKFKTL